MGMTLKMSSHSLLKYLFSIFVIVNCFFLNGIYAGDGCNTGCPAAAQSNKPGKLRFQPGQAYTYDVNSVLTVYLSGRDAQETTLQILGQAQIFAEKNCQYTLQLNKMDVLGPDKKNHKFGDQIQINKPVKFTLSNDELQPEICADETDSEFGLNVKRSIISMFQSADSKRSEIDVFGSCDTTFSTIKSGPIITVTKIRDLNGCAFRETISDGFISSVFNEKAGVKSTPLLNGDYNMEQQFNGKNGILTRVQLNEEYSYVPFTSGEAGARTKVVTKIQFKSKANAAAPKLGAAVATKKSIIFENPSIGKLANVQDVLLNALNNTIMTYQNNVGPKAAGQFTELIRLMRFATTKDLSVIYQKIKAGTAHTNRQLARKVYFDALFRTGTGESVEVCANLVKSQEMDDKEKRLVYLSFNLVQTMTKEALLAVNKLLDENPPLEAYLSIGNLVNKYCRKNSCEAKDIKSISEKFVNKLNNCKADSKHQENVVVAILKGLRNTNNLVSPALDKVMQCTGEKFATRIRVAAIQALVAGPCSTNVETTVWNLLKNINEDSEIRIQAYLTASNCPSGKIASDLKKLLDDEKIYQVGSFITTHLASLRASTDLHRENARNHFANVRTTNKFPIDFRRYSFNHEFSYAVPSMGLSASADTNIIYSQYDYIPRSATLNVTGELFGNHFNVFEFNGRQENLASIVEHNFGPKGKIRTDSTSKFIQSIVESFNEEQKKNEKNESPKRRGRRGIREDLNQFSKTVNLKNEVNQDLDLDLSVKFFGSELMFLSLGDNMPTDPRDFLSVVNRFAGQAIVGAKDFQHTFESHALFLDGELVYPTGIGFPLKLIAQGAGVVRFEASGKFDLEKILTDMKNAKFNLKVVPSYNLELSGKLVVDGWSVTTGLEVNGAVHTSTGAEIEFALIEETDTIDINVKFPIKKQEIFTFDHQVVFVTQERGHESIAQNLKFSSIVKEFNGCYNHLNRFIGITFCSDISVTTPGGPGTAAFPLTGSNHVGISLEVDDVYNFKVTFDEKNEKYRSIEITFDTPGSQFVRTTILKLEASIDPKIYARISLKSPYRNAAIEAGFNNNDKELAVYAEANNGPEQYVMKLGFKKLGCCGTKQEYSPIVIYRTPNAENNNLFGYRIDGKIIVESEPGKPAKYTFNKIEIKNDDDPDPFQVDGWIEFFGSKISTDLDMRKSFRTGKITGDFEFSTEIIKLDWKYKTNFHDLANGLIKYELIRGENHFKNDLLFIYGPDFESTTKRVELYQEYNYEMVDVTVKSLKFQNRFKALFIPINFKLNGEYDLNTVKYDFECSYRKHKIGSDLDVKLNGKSNGDYDGSFGLTVNDHYVRLATKREIRGNESNVKNKLTTSFGATFELNGVVAHRFSAQDADISLDGSFTFTEKQDPYKYTFVLTMTPKQIISKSNLLSGNTELGSYNIDINRGENTKGTFDVSAKDLFIGKGNFKVNVNGVGDASVILNFKKLTRKIKIDVKYTINAPIYNILTDIYYDFEKDNSKKWTIDTKNKVERDSMESTNVFSCVKDKYELDFSGRREGALLNVEKKSAVSADFSLKLPSQRKITGELKRQITTEVNVADESTNGLIHFYIKDELPNRETRTISLDGKLTDGNIRKRFFNLVHDFEFKNFDGKNLIVKSNVKHIPNGHFKTAALTLTVIGSYMPVPVEYVFSIDEYCSEHAVYRTFVKFGTDYDINVNGEYHLGGRAKPTSYIINVGVELPQTQIKSLKLQSNGKFLLPQTDNGIFEGQINGIASMRDKVISLETSASGNANTGNGKIKLSLPDRDPVEISGSYKYDDSDEDAKGYCTLQVDYGKEKTIKFDGNLQTNGINNINLLATLQTPIEAARNVEFSFNATKTSDNDYTTSAQIITNANKYGFNSHIIISDTNPSADIVIYNPVKDIKFHTSVTRLGEHKYAEKLLVENLGDFNFDGSSEVSYQSMENFYIKFDIHSPYLKMNKIHGEVNSKHGSGGKGIEFKVLKEAKNLFSGHADYVIKEEKGRTVIEGQGNIKLTDKQRNASFKFIRSKFEEATDKETGMMFVFNGLLGTHNIVAELKLTNKIFHVRNTVCEEKTQCTNFEIKSAFKQIDVDNLKHELLVSVDLRKLGYLHEFGLKAETERNGYTIKHNLDIHLQSQDKTKYQFKVYINENDAGTLLVLPTRTMAIETTFRYPKDSLFGKYDISGATYLDKVNNPGLRTIIGISGDIKHTTQMSITSQGELYFRHPKMKEMKIIGSGELNGDRQFANGRIEFDLFSETNQAIIVLGTYSNIEKSYKGFNVTTELKTLSRGFNFEYGFSGHTGLSIDQKQLSIAGSAYSPSADIRLNGYLFASDNKFELLINGFNEEILNIIGSYDLHRVTAEFKSTMKCFGSSPIELNSKLNGYTSLRIELIKKDLAKATGEIVIGKEANFHIQYNGKDLFKGKIALDQAHFLASEYKINEEDIKSFLKNVQQELKKQRTDANQEMMRQFTKVQKVIGDQYNIINTGAPDLSVVRNDYENELEKIVQELMADKTIKELIEFATKLFTTVSKTLSVVFEILVTNGNVIRDLVIEFSQELIEAFNEKILPLLQDTYDKLEHIFTGFYEDMIDLATILFERGLHMLKAFEGDFAKIGAILSDAFKNIASFTTKYYTILRDELVSMYKSFVDTIEAFPGIDGIKKWCHETYSTFIVPENLVKILHEVVETLKDTLPTNELRDFVTELADYLEMKINRKDVNDVEMLKKMYLSFIKAFRSIIEMVKQQQDEYPLTGIDSADTSIFAPIPFSLAAFKRIPLLSNLRVSTWNYFRNEPGFSIRDLFTAYRPYAFDPWKFLPPFSIHGQIADGSHVFTFDGRQYTITGSKCQHILVQDFVNGNFSIIGHINDGRFKSITLIDKGDVIEVTDQGAVTLNNKPNELPIHKENIHVWRRYFTITAYTSYGAGIMCTIDLRVCNIAINGFYYGKIRGILGNGNSEPFDDFTLPNGKITENVVEFVNAYKSSKTCDGIPAAPNRYDIAEQIKKTEQCTRLFNFDSSLSYCYLFINPFKYESACNSAVEALGGDASAESKQDSACNIAFTYVSACRLEKIKIAIPDLCTKCDAEHSIGSSYTVTIPKKLADIIFVVDTATGQQFMNEFVQPAVFELRKELRTRDITDVQVAIIGYNNKKKYINHYTTNGGKLDIVAKPGALKNDNNDGGPDIDGPIEFGQSDLNTLSRQLYDYSYQVQNDLGLLADATAFRDAIDYPFRAGTAKIVIAVRSDTLEHSPNPLKIFGAVLASNYAKYNGITVHMAGPVDGIKMSSKDPNVIKNFVGFNSKYVLTMADAKKRTNLGSAEQRTGLQYDSDLGIDMVLSENGYVFNTNTLKNLKTPKDKKQFVTVFAIAIADQVSKTEITSDCECKLSHGLYPIESCEVTEIKTVAPSKKPAGRG